MGRKKRFNYDILNEIIGLDFEKAKEICYFNGYLLTNESESNSENSFYHIRYELRNNKVVKSYFSKKEDIIK